MSIPSNDPATPFSYTVTGTGIIPGLTPSPAALAFGNQNLDTDSVAQTVTITNSGTAGLTVANVNLVGTNPDQFRITQDTCSGATLIPAATCLVSGVFHPLAAGAQTASILLISNDPDSPFVTVGLTGTGIVPGAPQGLFAPLVLDFDEVESSLTAVQSTTLTNVGTGTINITSLNLGGQDPGAFTLADDCVGAALDTGEFCTINVTFSPVIMANFNAVITVTNDAINNSELFVVLVGSSVPFGFFNTGCALSPATVPGLGMSFAAIFSTLSVGYLALRRRKR